jgi:hypothetical protein
MVDARRREEIMDINAGSVDIMVDIGDNSVMKCIKSC